jgi:membrane protease YdiL (CAAX protease family)
MRAGWRLGIFVVLVVTLVKAGALLIRRLLPGADHATTYLVGGTASFLVLLLCSRIMGWSEHRSLADFGLPWRNMFGARFWQGALLGFVSIACLLVILGFFGAFHIGSMVLRGADIWKWAAGYALVFLLVALLEEFGTRGYALFTLSTGIGFWPAAALSTALFVYMHSHNSGETGLGMVNLGLFGLLNCLLLRRTGDLWMPIGLHMAFDWGETFFFGVANSGEQYPGRLFVSSSSGPVWLSGGSAGPEGSVVYTLLLAVTLLLCSVWLRETMYPRVGGWVRTACS